MAGDESRQNVSHQLPGAAGVSRRDLVAHLLDFAHELGVKLEMAQEDRNAGLRHGGVLPGEIVGDLACHLFEKLGQGLVGRVCENGIT